VWCIAVLDAIGEQVPSTSSQLCAAAYIVDNSSRGEPLDVQYSEAQIKFEPFVSK